MALFSRRKDTNPDEAAGSGQSKVTALDTVAEIRPGRRRTVGQLLRETREGYGSDIPRVASALRIRAAYLEAIEEGRYDRLPGPVYALGFVRAYAVHLGLDGEEAVRRFKLEAEGFEAQRDLSFPVPLAERSIPGGAMVLAAVILAVCAYGIWYYVSATARPRPERVGPVPAELAKQVSPPVSAAAPVALPPPAAAAPAAASLPPAVPGALTGTPAAAPATPAAEANAPAAAQAPSVPPPPTTVAALPPPEAAPAPSSPPPAAAAPAAAPLPPPPAATPAPGEAAVAPASPSPAAPPPAVASEPPPPPPPPPQTAALPPTAGATPVPDEPKVYGLANGETRIVIRALSDSWIQIRDKDHKPIFTRELHEGDTYHVPDEPGVTMKTGKGAGLAITVDGRQTPPIGGAVRPNVYLDPDRLLAGTAVAE